VTCDGFFSDLLEISNSIFCSRDGEVWENMRNALGFISHNEEEWRGIVRVMFSMIMDEFCHRKVLDPIERCGAAINAEIGF
jgi:hypothetical protein